MAWTTFVKTVAMNRNGFTKILSDVSETLGFSSDDTEIKPELSRSLRPPLSNDAVRQLIIRIQKVAIDAYVELYERNILSPSNAAYKSTREFQGHGHPLQDPLGVLTHALFLIRIHFAAYKDVTCESPTSVMQTAEPRPKPLPYGIRVDIGAILSLFHKLVTHNYLDNPFRIPQATMSVLMTMREQPFAEYEWQCIASEFSDRESYFVRHHRLHGLILDSPLTHCEDALASMQKDGFINHDMLTVMRGAVFFLIGACLFNPNEDVFESFNEYMPPALVGRALAAVLITAALAVTEPSKAYRMEAEADVYRAAHEIAQNALAEHAYRLRVKDSPYFRDEVEPFKGHPSTRLVSRRALHVVVAVYGA